MHNDKEPAKDMRIFSGIDYYNMAVAVTGMAYLHYESFGRLNNIIAKIKGLDDPYYMEHLSKETYVALIATGKNCPIAA